jgi:hypothetical protein
MSEIFTALGNFGFPIVVSIYLLVRFEKKLDDLTKVISENNGTTKELVKAIDNLIEFKTK